MASAPGTPLLLMAGLTIAAIALLWWALRGRRDPVPPSCRACGYDVSARPADSTRCSECGADLSVDGAVVTSFRRRRRTWAIVASAILLLAGWVGVEGASRLPWNAWYVRHAPAWEIHRRARSDPWPGGDPFRGEWYRREGLSPALIDHLLDVRGNAAVPFAPAWDLVLLGASRPGGTMTDDQRQRLARQVKARPMRVPTPAMGP